MIVMPFVVGARTMCVHGWRVPFTIGARTMVHETNKAHIVHETDKPTRVIKLSFEGECSDVAVDLHVKGRLLSKHM